MFPYFWSVIVAYTEKPWAIFLAGEKPDYRL